MPPESRRLSGLDFRTLSLLLMDPEIFPLVRISVSQCRVLFPPCLLSCCHYLAAIPMKIRRTTNKDRVLQYGTVAATLLKDIGSASNHYLAAMPMRIRRTTNKDRVLQYGTVAATLLKDIGNASNQPHLQAIASVSLLIMETVQRVRDNKDACFKMAERVHELVCAIINICRDSEADLAPAMIRTITQFSETLEKILVFVRKQVKGDLIRWMFRSMEDADLIKECNEGLKHALDVFGTHNWDHQVQSGIIATMTMAEMQVRASFISVIVRKFIPPQKDAKQRHEELIAILKERHSTHSSTSGYDGGGSSSSRRKRPSKVNTDLSRSVSMLPAPPKIFYGRDDEVEHAVFNITTRSQPARITICGAEGMGKTALALAVFGVHRYFVECEGAKDAKQLVAALARCLGIDSTSKKHVIRHLTTIGTEETPVLVVLDALDQAWKPYENCSDVEDFLSLLADLQHLALIVTIRGGERPRQVKWTRPFLQTLRPLSPSATRATFLDISDVQPDEPDLEELLEITGNSPGAIVKMARLASFEACAAVVARWREDPTPYPTTGHPDGNHLPPDVQNNTPDPVASSSSLNLDDIAAWLATYIWNQLSAAYNFIAAPSFIHDKTSGWDHERLENRLNSFQGWVWSANAALSTASSSDECFNELRSSNPTDTEWHIFSVWICVYKFPCIPYWRSQEGVLVGFLNRTDIRGRRSFWNPSVMISLPLTWMGWSVISLVGFLVALGAQNFLSDLQNLSQDPPDQLAGNLMANSSDPFRSSASLRTVALGLSISQLALFTIIIVWSLIHLVMSHVEIRRCMAPQNLPPQEGLELEETPVGSGYM
ncbi:hypothetical protein B0H19DRAFT_1073806 [Mycena capillaripes]|nr:hypothetical protein B0H19DRAFT_1073806 [Mycena capillaripes]